MARLVLTSPGSVTWGIYASLSSSNYLLEGFDSDDENYDPSRESFMYDGELHEGASEENEGEHTPADTAARTVERAGGVAMPPLVRQPQP
jgi:hypothetical protein